MVRLPFNKKISTDDGLSSYNVKKIFQDKYGFIWIVTQDGLNRYDGKNFLIYNKSADTDHQLLGSDVWDIEEDKTREILWVVTSYGGLNGISLKTTKVCFSLAAKISKEGFSNDWIKCIKQYKDNLWIGTYNGLSIYNITTKQFDQFEPIPFKSKAGIGFSIDKIHIDQYENIWLFIANYGIAIYSGKNRKVINYFPLTKMALKEKSTYKQFNTIISLYGENLLVGTNQGFRRFEYTPAGITSVAIGLHDNDTLFDHSHIEASGMDSSHFIWFSTPSKLLKADVKNRIIEEVKDARTNPQNEWLTNIYDIFFDNSNNIWLGTGKGVTYTKNILPAFMPYYVSEDQATRIDHAYYIYPVSDTVLYACAETGLFKINLYKNEYISLDKERKYYYITEHSDKNLLVSNENGLFVCRPQENRVEKISKWYPELSPISGIPINSISYAGDSLAIIGTETANGFYLWNYKIKTLRKISPREKSGTSEDDIVNTTYKDSKNRFWVLGDKLITLYNFNTGELKTINLTSPDNNIPYNLYFDVCEARGYFWIAAYGVGLIQVDANFKIKNVFSMKDGLSNTGVYKLFAVNDSLIFITTNYGLSVLNLNTNLFSNFFKEDGLNSNAFEENCGMFKNNKIYVGGISGITIIDPKNYVTNNIPPALSLGRIRIETSSGFKDTSNSSLTALTIPNNVLQTTVSFTALNYTNSLRTTYAYRIKEINGNWIHLGTQSFVSLVGLNPGKHTLLLKAANENNIWNERPLEITLKYLPKWYQTLWFTILVIVAIIVLIYSIYAYRISQIKKQQMIRRDISKDLHDEIGSILTGVKIFTHLAKREPHKPEHLNKIEESLKLATIAFYDVIWILNDKRDSISQFMERVQKFAFPIVTANNIHLQCEVEPGIREKLFSKAEKRHLLMIVKESVNNSIKYADCKIIKIVIYLIKDKPALIIEDNGKGFDFHIKSEGSGLKNLAYRAEQIGYLLEITSIIGKGTRVKLVKR